MTPRRSYGRHGFHALKRRVAVAGMDAVDRRTLGGRELVGWWDNQISHLGGKDEISHPELTLAKRAGVLEMLIRQAEGDLLARGILLRRPKTRKTSPPDQPHPLLPEYRALVKEQREILKDLGLKRRAKPITPLAEYVAQRYGGNPDNDATAAATAASTTSSSEEAPTV